MKGSGTQADPFEPTTWLEFVTAIGTEGAYVEFPPEPGVIDVSSLGFFNIGTNNINCPILCTSINGNGWTIHGLSWQNSYMFGKKVTGDVTIKNLNFTSFLGFLNSGNYADFFYFSKGEILIDNCVFTGTLDNNGFEYHYQNNLTYNQCSLTFELKHGAGINQHAYTASEMVNCNIKLTGSTSTTGNIINAKPFDFCYLRGALTFTGNSAFLLKDNGSTSTLHYSVIDIDLINGGSGNSITIDNRGAKIVNKDKIKGFTTITLDDDEFAVTKEQFCDAAYLKQIGFAIGVKS